MHAAGLPTFSYNLQQGVLAEWTESVLECPTSVVFAQFLFPVFLSSLQPDH
jgi:hypothetical protein